MDGVAGWLGPRTDLAVPGMRTNGRIHVRIWLFWVTGEVTRPVAMFGCTDMALSPGLSTLGEPQMWQVSCVPLPTY